MVLLYWGAFVYPQNYDTIIERILIGDYVTAKTEIEALRRGEQRATFSVLNKILEHRGQEKAKDSLSLIRLDDLNLSDDFFLIKDLCNAYYQLFYSRVNNNALSLFEALFQKVRDREEDGLKKLILKGFLILYSRENTLDKNQFDYYLNIFKTFNLSVNEKGLMLYYQNFFDGMSASFPERYESSIEELRDYLLIYEKELFKEVRLNMYQNIALDFRVKKKLDSAVVYLEKIIKSKPSKYRRSIKFNTYLELGRIATLKNQIPRAKQYFKQAEYNFDSNDVERSRILFERYMAFNFFEIQKEYDSAYYYLKKSRLSEARFNYKENNQKISELNTRLRTKEKEKQILIEQQRAATNRNWLIAACLALLLGSGIAVLLQKNTSKKRQLAEKETLLKQQRVDNLLKEQEMVSIDAMIQGQEKERQKVANELHDDLGSLMATVKLHFDNVKADHKDPALLNAQKLLDEAYQKIRGMAHAKNSGVMAKEGLLNAVRKMANTITETNALAVTVEDYGLADRMENSLELTIFRIVQELVANVIKHAGATTVNIQFTQHEDKLNIIVEDNGKGFDMTVVKPRQNGMGLESIEKRIEHLEGSFTVDSVLGKGTSILIDIPV